MSYAWPDRLKAFAAVLLIGDGVAAMAAPAEVRMWNVGPRSFRRVVEAFAKHPARTRLFGAAEALLALWWLRRQTGT